MVVMRCLDDLENYRVCELPATAFYVANFLSSAEEKYLWNKVFAAPLPRWTKVNGRRVQNWGGIVGKKALIQVNDIPEWLSSFMEKFGSISGLFPADMKPNHVLVNEYEPGQGIMPHTDGLAYYPMVINVTLGSHAVLDLFKQTDGKNCCIGSLLLEPCSLFVMKDELYTDHLHGIENRCTDTVDEKVKNKALCSEQYSHGCVLERGKRISLTIRNIPRFIRGMLVLARGRDPEELIKEDAYDIEAWYVLIHRLKKDPIDACRPHFEKLVKVFPSCGLYWKVYVEQEIAAGNFAQAESLFDRCLLEVLSIDLWKCYVKYVCNYFSTRNVRKVRDAFEFALDKVGFDHQAYSIYNDYVDFLVAANSAGEIKLDESIAIIRGVYLRAINTPMAKHSLLWKRYCAFEQKVDMRQANDRTAAVRQVYLRIQQLSLQMDAVMCNIDRKRVSVPCTNSASENEQVLAWREFIAWEQSNPLQAVDYCLYARRVIYAYEQALLCFSFHVEFWCEAVEFLQNAAERMFELAMEEAGRNAHKDTVALFERAINSSMCKTLLIYCLYAEFEEGCNRLANVHSIYRRFISRSDVDPSLAYIHYMKFANRTEGIRSVRTIFKAAREDGRVKSEVYTVAALLEYFGNQDASVAVRIFELGLKKFPSDSDFALSYTNFLLHFNEDASIRVLFERVLSSGNLPLEKSIALWDQYIDFESRIGGLTGIVKVSERRQDALSRQFGEMPTALLVDRYRFMDLMPAPEDDLRMLGYPELIAMSRSYETNGMDNDKGGTSAVVQPDLTHLIPFKPRRICRGFFHPVPGGDFPPPPSTTRILSMIPPPRCFDGPFVKVDELLAKLQNFDLSTSSGESEAAEKGIKKEKSEFQRQTAYPARASERELVYGAQPTSLPVSRVAEQDDEKLMVYSPPVHDIYLRRRQKKF